MLAGTPEEVQSRYPQWSALWCISISPQDQDAKAYVVVRAALASREDSIVDALLEVLRLVRVLAEEDEACTGTTERLVRRGGDDVAVLEGVRELARRDEAARVRDVGHQERAVLVRDGAERRVVPVPRVRGRAADDELRLEDLRLRRERLVVDELRLGVEAIGERLEVDGRRSHLLLGSLLNFDNQHLLRIGCMRAHT